MRILHVHSGNIFGGVERILIALAGHQRVSEKFEHIFALTFHGRLEDSLSAAGAPLFAMPSLRLANPWQWMQSRRSLRTLLRRHKFDLAIVHSAWSHLAFAGVLQSAGLPLIFWLHTAAQAHSFLERAARLRFPDTVISVSKAVDSTARNLFPSVPSEVVHAPLALDTNAFDRSDREATRTALGAAPEDVVMVQTSRMEAWKGHAILLRALANLPERARWKCWIAGGAGNSEEAAYLHSLRQLSADLKLDQRVQFLGPRSDVPALLKAADIYCQANTEGEGFSIAFVEACYAGLPIVTSALGGAFEIVDARNGFLLPPENIQAFSKTLAELIEDRELRRVLGGEARRRALERCDPIRQFTALENVFLKTVAAHA